MNPAPLLLLPLLAAVPPLPPPVPAPTNAAAIYRQAFAAWQAIPPADQQAISDAFGDPGGLVARNPFLAAALDRAAPAIERFVAASRLANCDWGLDRSEGFSMLLPHLMPMRELSRAAALSAVGGFIDGRCDAACDALAAVSRSQRHLTGDPLMIESLVGGSVLGLAHNAIGAAIDAGAIDRVSATRLFEAMPAGAVEALAPATTFRNEFAMFAQELRRIAAGRGPDLVDSEDGEVPDELSGIEGAVRAIAARDSAAIEGILDKARDFSERAAAAVADGDREARTGSLAAIDAEIAALVREDPEVAGVVLQLLPSYAAFGNALNRVDAQMEGVRGRLAAIADGEDPRLFANAAVEYLRAAAAIDATPPRLQVSLELLRREPAAASDEMRAEAEGWLDRLDAAAFEPLRRGGLARRCDFDFGRPEAIAPEDTLLRRVLPSLRGGARMLLVEARRNAAQAVSLRGEGAAIREAADSLREAARIDLLAIVAMARHLGGDATVGGTLVSASILEELAASLAAMRQEALLDETTLEALRVATAALPRGGPGGPLGAAAAATRIREAAAQAAAADRAASLEAAIVGVAIASEGPAGLRRTDEEWMLGADDLLDLAAWERLAAHGRLLGSDIANRLDRVVRVGDSPVAESGEPFAPVLPADRLPLAPRATAAIEAIDAVLAVPAALR